MSDPCQQAPTIERMEDKLDKVLESMQQLAGQKVQIDFLIKGHEDLRSWIKGHERRLQIVEQQPGQIAGKSLVIVATIAGSVFSGLLVYLLTH